MKKDQIFSAIENFFISLDKSLDFSKILLITVGLFLFAMLVVIFLCSKSYENKLLKAINRLNKYFQTNPKIDESNLVSFNNRMRSEGVPKELRKQWQTYVLYQEHKASEYMSYDNCVKEPMKNSTYARDVKALNYVAVILVVLSLVLNCFHAYQVSLFEILRTIILAPAIILLLNSLTVIFLNARHTSIVTDLTNNYQYFENNIDKATETIPSYVDYEILFDKNEIKSGIPILYAYLENRAQMEQKELELARLKNVEHDKFNFDEMGDNAALVLERAMQESENYIAERKKFAQDIEQINSEIAQEDIQYRELTKDYNRQMQVSKETFANFKQQLEDSTSTIQSNYLKKQQQQELDRQRNLERDFDVATERHKKIVDSFHEDLDGVEQDRNNSRKALEDAMKAEFANYKSKVYNAAREALQNEENEKLNKAEARIVALEEELHKKNEILKKYVTVDDVEESGERGASDYRRAERNGAEKVSTTNVTDKSKREESEFVFNYLPTEEDLMKEKLSDLEKIRLAEANSNATQYQNSVDTEGENNSTEHSTTDDESEVKVDKKPAGKRGRPKKAVSASPVKLSRGRGRPRKVANQLSIENKLTTAKGASKRGRPRKTEDNNDAKSNKSAVNVTSGKRGRPRKQEITIQEIKKVTKRGRPKKQEIEAPVEAKRGRGRPRKAVGQEAVRRTTENNSNSALTKKKRRGRPAGGKGGQMISADVDDIDAFLKEIDDAIKLENDKIKVASKALEAEGNLNKKSKK